MSLKGLAVGHSRLHGEPHPTGGFRPEADIDSSCGQHCQPPSYKILIKIYYPQTAGKQFPDPRLRHLLVSYVGRRPPIFPPRGIL